MKVRDIFLQLENGELSNMAIGGQDHCGIMAKDFRKVIPHLNLALTELYKRFSLKTKTVVVQQYDHITHYRIHPDYAETNETSLAMPKYIKDSRFHPFTNSSEVLKIEAVFDEKGENYFLNDSKQPYSLFTPEDNVVQVPFPLASNAMSVQYRCDHDALFFEGEENDVLNQEVNISATYLQPLLLFVASRYFSTKGGQEGQVSGANFGARFEVAINQIKMDNLAPEEDNSNRQIEDNGWV